MNCLLVYPESPNTFWSFRHALKFLALKASFPPLGLLTVSTMLPGTWVKRLVDMNIRELRDADIDWADVVFISAMSIQCESADSVIARCQAMGKRIVAGGPHFTTNPHMYSHVDHLVLNEAELTLPEFLRDFEEGHASHCYTSKRWADAESIPVPDWSLISMKEYSSMNLQYSRGCPFDCEFCDITVLLGREPRTKSRHQIIAELDALLEAGWKGPLFFVDDNFIGNRRKLKNDILPAITEWMEQHRRPFFLNTEASINLADDEELLRLMVHAGFEAVFIGIETPHENSLIECGKSQNRHRDLVESVRVIQRAGIEVQGGFILGFDEDPPAIFDRLTTFIQETGIVTAMVGLLNAPTGTRLHARMQAEGRLLHSFSGNNMDAAMNFVPRMDKQHLIEGYHAVLEALYTPKHYYARVHRFLSEFNPEKKAVYINGRYIFALLRSMLLLGIIGPERSHYWRLFFWSLVRKPQLFPLAILFAIYGFHFRKVAEEAMR
ncbi:MAG: B12-binding domain-containing radical SAM protein [Bacteroidetes bacterium]|nr:B12-binding domain-containing radical SAM protein [Bacteroidota bacterium]